MLNFFIVDVLNVKLPRRGIDDYNAIAGVIYNDSSTGDFAIYIIKGL